MRVSRILDKKRITTTGENAGKYSIKIRLSYTLNKRTIQRAFPTGYYASEAEWKKIMGNPSQKILQEIQSKVDAMYEKAKEIIKDKVYIDPEAFGRQLTAKGSLNSPLTLMREYASRQKKISTRRYYETAASAFEAFAGRDFSFAEVTPAWLERYAEWELKRGNAITTVGMNDIAMRTIFNLASSDEYRLIGKDVYPFRRNKHEKNKYQIPKKRGRKIALKEDDKNVFLRYRTLDIVKRKAIDFWKLSYFCGGVNLTDILHWRFRNFTELSPNGFVTFDRQKTGVSIESALRKEVIDIIEYWGSKDHSPNNFVFPVLRDGMTAKAIKNKVQDFIKEVNKGLKLICEELEMKKVTTYSARHTFATVAKNKGASVEYVQSALGHLLKETTKDYLGDFEQDQKRKVANLL